MTEQGLVDPVDNSINSIVLDIKALMLLATDSQSLDSKITKNFTESHDDSVREFVRKLAPTQREKPLPHVVTAIGELVLTAFLLLLGLSIVAPVLVGGTGPAYLIHYFGSAEAATAGNPAGDGLVIALNLLLSVLLLFSAVYSLRRAASNLRSSDLRS